MCITITIKAVYSNHYYYIYDRYYGDHRVVDRSTLVSLMHRGY